MAFPVFRAPKESERGATCNWCWTSPAHVLWVKQPEGGITKFKKEVAIPVCHTCENTIHRNYVENGLPVRMVETAAKVRDF